MLMICEICKQSKNVHGNMLHNFKEKMYYYLIKNCSIGNGDTISCNSAHCEKCRGTKYVESMKLSHIQTCDGNCIYEDCTVPKR